MKLNRREFIKGLFLSAVALVLPKGSAAQAVEERPVGLLDRLKQCTWEVRTACKEPDGTLGYPYGNLEDAIAACDETGCAGKTIFVYNANSRIAVWDDSADQLMGNSPT